jgi:SAM-dependent methyltransferase
MHGSVGIESEDRTGERQRWDDRYAAPGYLFGEEPNAFLQRQAGLLKRGASVFSVADGDGRNGVWLAEQGLVVHTIDFSPTAVAKAQELAAQRGVSIRAECVDVIGWDWPEEAYDVVVAIFVQFTLPDERARMFAGMKQALTPGGLLLIEGYGPRQLDYATGGPRNLAQLYTPELMRKAFGDMTTLAIEEYDAELAEGGRHVGMSALVDLIAVK